MDINLINDTLTSTRFVYEDGYDNFKGRFVIKNLKYLMEIANLIKDKNKMLIIFSETSYKFWGEKIKNYTLTFKPLIYIDKNEEVESIIEKFANINLVISISEEALKGKIISKFYGIKHIFIPTSLAFEQLFVRSKLTLKNKTLNLIEPDYIMLSPEIILTENNVAFFYAELLCGIISLIDVQFFSVMTVREINYDALKLYRNFISKLKNIENNTLEIIVEGLIILGFLKANTYFGGAISGVKSYIKRLCKLKNIHYVKSNIIIFSKLLKIYSLVFNSEITLSNNIIDYNDRLKTICVKLNLNENLFYSNIEIVKREQNIVRLNAFNKSREYFALELKKVESNLNLYIKNYLSLNGEINSDFNEIMFDAIEYSPELTKNYNVLTFLRDFGLLNLV